VPDGLQRQIPVVTPCGSSVLTRLDDRPRDNARLSSRFKLWVARYFLSPTDLFFSLRTEAWHFLHLVA